MKELYNGGILMCQIKTPFLAFNIFQCIILSYAHAGRSHVVRRIIGTAWTMSPLCSLTVNRLYACLFVLFNVNASQSP